MSKSIRKTLALILSIVMLMSALPMSYSFASPETDYVFIRSGSEVTITGYKGTDAVVIIPEKISVSAVVAIGEGAFSSKTAITSVTIPGTVRSISSGAFYGCSALEDIELAEGVVIEDWAFSKTPVVLP